MSEQFQSQVAEFEAFIQKTGLSPERVAAELGIKPETLRKYRKGYQAAPEVVLKALRNLGAVWASRSTYTRTQASRPDILEDSPGLLGPNGRIVSLAAQTFCRVPVVSWAQAGVAHDYTDMCNQLEEWVDTECKDPNSFALIIEGDSMEPKFEAGYRVVFSPNSEPRNGDYVVARLREGHGVLFKKFRRIGKEGQTVRLESLNPAYEPLEYHVSAFQFVYPAVEVKALLRR